MLSERQKQILWAVINDYIASAEPVGSRTVAKKEGFSFSAATIRNEMSDLEEMGFLEQPHTSAGRIPSQKGYRFYVDHLLTPRMWLEEDVLTLRQLCTQGMDRVEQAFQHTSSIISDLTNYVTIILGPKLSDNRLKHLQLIPLSDRFAVSILVTNQGHVHQRRVTLPEEVPFSSIERLVQFLNHRLNGFRLTSLKSEMEEKLVEELIRHVDQYEKMLGLLDQMIQTDEEERVYTSGTKKILDQPEFRDVEKMKSLLGLVEKNQRVIRLLEPSPSEGVQIRIGDEHHVQEVNHCSVVSASYMINGEPVGTIGVIGPTRMDYSRVVGLIDFLAKDFSLRLHDLYREW